MAEWSRVTNTTINDYLRGAEPNVLRNRKVTAMIQARGRLTYDHSGDAITWRLQFKDISLQGVSDGTSLTFASVDQFKTLTLPVRGYAATNAMHKKERLMNKSTEAIVNVYSEIAPLMLQGIEAGFGDEMYVDGNATGNELKLHGIESFMGNSGAASGGYIGTPSDAYAGINTDLAYYGGNWSGSWPTGSGDAHYDWVSPLLVDYTDTAWSATTKTWPNTCVEALRYGIIKGKKNKSTTGMLDMIILDGELYRQFQNTMDAKERITVQKGKAGKGDMANLVSLGFSDVTDFDGVEITYEYGVPSNIGYGWSFSNLELMSWQPQLFVPTGPIYDEATMTYRFTIDCFANLRCNPRYFVKWLSIT